MSDVSRRVSGSIKQHRGAIGMLEVLIVATAVGMLFSQPLTDVGRWLIATGGILAGLLAFVTFWSALANGINNTIQLKDRWVKPEFIPNEATSSGGPDLPLALPGELLIVVATFDDPAGHSATAEREIADAIRTEAIAAKFSEVRIEITDRIFRRGHLQRVQDFARESGAALVIWGEHTNVRVVTEVLAPSSTLMNGPIRIDTRLKRSREGVVVTVDDGVDHYVFVGKNLSNQTAFLALVALANAARHNHDLESARALVGRALSIASSAGLQDGLEFLFYEQAAITRELDGVIAATPLAAALATIYPKFAPAQNLLGILQYKAGKVSEAQASFENAIGIDANNSLAHANLGNARAAQGDLTAAESSYRRALELDPDNSLLYNNLGTVHNDRAEIELAKTAFENAIRLDPNNSLAHANLAAIQMNLGDLDQAEASYQNSLTADPNNTRAHNGLGDLLTDQGNLDQAEASYQNSLTADPNNTRAHNGLGIVHFLRGELDQAEAEFQRAIEADPENDEARSNLDIVGGSRGQSGNPKQSIERSTSATAASTGTPQGLIDDMSPQ